MTNAVKTKHHTQRDDSADASAVAAGIYGTQEKSADHAYGQAAPIYDEAEKEIANNVKGGAGYFAEAHHTASFNVDAQAEDLPVRADRLGSHEFGSSDILLDNDEAYNPKFYHTAEDSYRAGAELISDDIGQHAKYAGQTILVPSDQLDNVRDLRRENIDAALVSGDTSRADALETIRFDDHIHSEGVESIPLSYDDAQRGAEGIRDGALPDYAGDDTGLFSTGAEGALLAATIALVTSIGPLLIGDAAKVARGKMTAEQAAGRLKGAIQSSQLKTQVGWATVRGMGAAALTFTDLFDPTGSAFAVNLAIDAIQLSQQLKHGKLSAGEFGNAMLEKLADRGTYTALTAGSLWLMGPVGLLVPIIVKRTITDLKMQSQALKAWDNAAAAMREELRSRMRSVDLLTTIDQHYRNASVNVEANHRRTKQITNDLSAVQKLLGFQGGASSPGLAGDAK